MTRDNPTTLISKYSHHLIQCTIVQQNEHPLSSLNNLWCSFMHIIDYDIISSCVLNPIIHQCSFMHIIDYDIIRFCALNPICHWCSFMHIIIIQLYIYQCSRVTVAVTKVCNYALIKITKAVVIYMISIPHFLMSVHC